MARVQELADLVEPVERHTVVLRVDGDLAGHGRMPRFGPVFVTGVHRVVTDDELVIDRIVVVHDEPHRRALLHAHRVEVEAAVLDVDVHRHQAGAERRCRGRGLGGEHVAESGRRHEHRAHDDGAEHPAHWKPPRRSRLRPAATPSAIAVALAASTPTTTGHHT